MIRILPGEKRTSQHDEGETRPYVDSRLFVRSFLLTSEDDLTNLPTSSTEGITGEGGTVLRKCACGSTAHFTNEEGEVYFYELQNGDVWRGPWLKYLSQKTNGGLVDGILEGGKMVFSFVTNQNSVDLGYVIITAFNQETSMEETIFEDDLTITLNEISTIVLDNPIYGDGRKYNPQTLSMDFHTLYGSYFQAKGIIVAKAQGKVIGTHLDFPSVEYDGERNTFYLDLYLTYPGVETLDFSYLYTFSFEAE